MASQVMASQAVSSKVGHELWPLRTSQVVYCGVAELLDCLLAADDPRLWMEKNNHLAVHSSRRVDNLSGSLQWGSGGFKGRLM